jgi:hypothetical protein
MEKEGGAIKRKRASEKKQVVTSNGPAPKRARNNVKPISMVPVKDYSLDWLAHDTLRQIFSHVPAYHRRFIICTSKTWYQLLNEAPLCYLPLPPLVGFLSDPPVRLSIDGGGSPEKEGKKRDVIVPLADEMDFPNPTRMTLSDPQFWQHSGNNNNQYHGNVCVSVFNDNQCVFKHPVELCTLDNTRTLGLYNSEGYTAPVEDAEDPEESRFVQFTSPGHNPHVTVDGYYFWDASQKYRPDLVLNNMLVYGPLLDNTPNISPSLWNYSPLQWVLTHCPQCLKPQHVSYTTLPYPMPRENEFVRVVIIQVMVDMRALAAVVDTYRNGIFTSLQVVVEKEEEEEGSHDSIVDDDWSFEDRNSAATASGLAKNSSLFFASIWRLYGTRRTNLHLAQKTTTTRPPVLTLEELEKGPGHLHDYQRDAVQWMLNHESVIRQSLDSRATLREPLFSSYTLGAATFYYSHETERLADRYAMNSVDIRRARSTYEEMVFRGGIYADEMGLGKTRTVSAFIYHAYRCFPEEIQKTSQPMEFVADMEELLTYYPWDYNTQGTHVNWTTGMRPCSRPLVKTRAACMVVPNHLYAQWLNELAHIYPPEAFLDRRILAISSKAEHEACTYGHFMNAEVVLVTRNFLCNKTSYMSLFMEGNLLLAPIESEGEKKKYTYQVALRSNYAMAVDRESLTREKTCPLFELFAWPRVLYDEAHEGILLSHRQDNQVFRFMEAISRALPARSRWAVTGTPFERQPSHYGPYFPQVVNDESQRKTVHFLGLMDVHAPLNTARRKDCFQFVLRELYWANTKRNTESVNYLLPVKRTIKVVDLPTLQRLLSQVLLSEDARAVMQTVPIMPPSCDRAGFMQIMSTTSVSTTTTGRGTECSVYDILRTYYQYSRNEEKITRLREEKRFIDAERVFTYGRIERRPKKKKNKDTPSSSSSPEKKKKPKRKIRDDHWSDDDDEGGHGNDLHNLNSRYWLSKVLHNRQFSMPYVQASDVMTCFQAWADYYVKAYTYFNNRADIVADYLDIHGVAHGVCVNQLNKFLDRLEDAVGELTGQDLSESANLLQPVLVDQMGGKIAALLELLEAVWRDDPEDCVLVASEYGSVLKMIKLVLEKRGISVVTLAAHNVASKTKSMRLIQDETSSVRVVLLDLKYSSSGTNIVRASRIVLFDTAPPSSRNAARNTDKQAIARLHRQTQDKQVVLTRLVSRGFAEHLALVKLGICEDRGLPDKYHMMEEEEEEEKAPDENSMAIEFESMGSSSSPHTSELEEEEEEEEEEEKPRPNEKRPIHEYVNDMMDYSMADEYEAAIQRALQLSLALQQGPGDSASSEWEDEKAEMRRDEVAAAAAINTDPIVIEEEEDTMDEFMKILDDLPSRREEEEEVTMDTFLSLLEDM